MEPEQSSFYRFCQSEIQEISETYSGVYKNPEENQDKIILDWVLKKRKTWKNSYFKKHYPTFLLDSGHILSGTLN